MVHPKSQALYLQYSQLSRTSICAATQYFSNRRNLGQELRARLQRNITLWKDGVTFTHWNRLESNTAIQPVVVGSNETALRLASALDQLGYWIPAIRPPTVPKGMARLRITLSAAHSDEQIQGLCKVLSDLEQNLPRS